MQIATCDNSPYQRTHNPDKDHTTFFPSWFRDLLFFWGIRVCIVFLAGTLVYYSYLKKGISCEYYSLDAHFLQGLIIALMLLLGGYQLAVTMVLEELKYLIKDYECHDDTHPNSVSGHTFYSVWMFTLVLYLLELYKRTLASSDRFRILGEKQRWNTDWEIGRVNQFFGAFPSVSPYLVWLKQQDKADKKKRDSEGDSDHPINDDGGEKEGEKVVEKQHQGEGTKNGESSASEMALVRRRKEDWIVHDGLGRHILTIEEGGDANVKPAVKLGIASFAGVALGGQLIFTYWYGYHSLQQMFFGGTLGGFMVSVAILVSEVVLWVEEYWHHSLNSQKKEKRDDDEIS